LKAHQPLNIPEIIYVDMNVLFHTYPPKEATISISYICNCLTLKVSADYFLTHKAVPNSESADFSSVE
jgi:hypothetical protein